MKELNSIIFLLFFSFTLSAQTLFSTAIDLQPGSDRGGNIIEVEDGFIITSLSLCFGDVLGCAGVIKTDLEGNKIWDIIFEEYPNSIRIGSLDQLIVDKYGDILVCGDTYTEDKSFQSFVQKINVNGDTLWRKIYGDEHRNFSRFILEIEDEGYLLYWSEGENEGFTNRKLSILNYEGEVIWEKTLLDEFQYSQVGNLEKTLDDNLVMGYITNTWTTALSQGAAISKLSSSGEEIWRRNFHTSDFGGHFRIETLLNGGYVAAWVKDTFIQADDNGNLAMLIGLDSLGNTEWEYYFSAPGLRFIEGMTIAANGDIIGCGKDTNHDFGVSWIFRMTAGGELLWLRQYADTNNAISGGVLFSHRYY